MVDTKSVTWDVVTAGGGGLMRGVRQGLFEKITPEMVNTDHVIPGAATITASPPRSSRR